MWVEKKGKNVEGINEEDSNENGGNLALEPIGSMQKQSYEASKLNRSI